MNGTLSLHTKLSLSRDCLCKTHVNQCLFPFSRRNSCYHQHMVTFPRISKL